MRGVALLVLSLAACGRSPSGGSSEVETGELSTDAGVEVTSTEVSEEGEESEAGEADTFIFDHPDPPPPDPPWEPPDCELESFTYAGRLPDFDGIADFDGDGRLDLVERSTQGDPPWASAQIWMQQAQYEFVATPVMSLGHPDAGRLMTGDFDGDGHAELGYHRSPLGEFADQVCFHAWELGLELGPSVCTDTTTHGVDRNFTRTQDVNGDTFSDFVMPGLHSTPINLHFGHGDGSFAAALELPWPACYLEGFEFADIDENGELDLLAVGGCNDGTGLRALNIHRQVNGVFELDQASPETLNYNVGFVRAGEFDGLPGLDAVVRGSEQLTDFALHRADGAGNLSDYEHHPLPAIVLEAADFDGDGLDDLFAEDNDGLYWLRNVGGDFEACRIADQRPAEFAVERWAEGEAYQVLETSDGLSRRYWVAP